MTNAPTNAASAEVTAIDTQARGPLLLLLGCSVVWLVISGIFALITSIQLHSPHGRAQAMRESAFIYGWGANAGLAIGLWVLARLGGYPLRGLNWALVGTLFWNLGLLVGLIGIAIGDMTSFPFLQLPRYVQPLLAVAYAAIAIPGVLAWSGRRTDGTYAAQWYAVAALFVFPWLLITAQAVLLWLPVRGTVQAIAATWYGQGVWTLWLAPLALAGAYYIIPKVAGRVLPTYESAPLAFWTLVFTGSWLGARHLIGGPVPAWVPTMAVVASSLLLFHYMVVALNFRPIFGAAGNAAKFIRFGFVIYVLAGVIEFFTTFRGIALRSQFTFLATALEQLALYGAISMFFFGSIYFLVPRLTNNAWASAGLAGGHRVLVMVGVLVSVLALAAAGWSQASALLDPQVPFADIFTRVRTPLLINTAAQFVLLGANLLLAVNFFRTACSAQADTARAQTLFSQPSTLRAHAS
jgi:cytochrome c oxidase cbb3-type subunit I